MIQNKIQTVIGHKGHGKTKLTEALALLTKKPVIYADPRFQFDDKPKRRLHFKSVGEFRKWINNRTNFKIFMKYRLELIVNAFDDTFDELANIVLKMSDITFVVDEVDMFADTRMNNKKPFYKLIHYGRHDRIDIITTSRRPANISRNLTSQTDIFYFGKIREPADKEYIKKAVGQEYVAMVEKLNRFEFLKIDENFEPSILRTTLKDVELLSAD